MPAQYTIRPILPTDNAAIAAVIGGVVLLGSNSTTWTQTEAALRASEAMRAEWIGQREMRVVEDSRTPS